MAKRQADPLALLQPTPAPRPVGRPALSVPKVPGSFRLDQDVADWYCKESLRTGVPVATMQQELLTRFARARMKADAAPPPREPSRSRYIG